MRKLAFSLVELLIVIVLIGLISFLVIKLPSFSFPKSISVAGLRDALYPDGEMKVLINGKIISDKKVEFNCKNPEVFEYVNGQFEKKEYDKDIIFKYTVKNGIGDSFILKCENGYYVFKPFDIKKTDSFAKAEILFTNNEYKLEEGNYY
jgi:hypothetical protein